MTVDVAVAISTTGDKHRLDLLRRCVQGWSDALSRGGSLFVTVDGDEAACQRVAEVVYYWTGSVFRVGQGGNMKIPGIAQAYPAYEGTTRLGVAVNKNTGLELMMDNTRVEHLFLSDDDTWPLYPQSLDKHIGLPMHHSMVMWGKHRIKDTSPVLVGYTEWTWPRGVALYQTRAAVERVGGMDERFGPGGHEHVEYSQRIHNAGLTPAPFCSPASYATREGTGARALWHAEDMRRPGEKLGDHRLRRRDLTSVRRTGTDWDHINKIMAEREGSDAFVPFRASDNGRASATLCLINPSQGAEESK